MLLGYSNGKCKICSWEKGYCHKHHIIPKQYGGEDDKENIILLCPNHHAEAHFIGYEKFNIKYNLKGVKISKDKEKAIMLYTRILLEHFPSEDSPELTSLNNVEDFILKFLELKFKFTRIEAIARQMGIGTFGVCRDLGINYTTYLKETKYFKEEIADKLFKELITTNDNYIFAEASFNAAKIRPNFNLS